MFTLRWAEHGPNLGAQLKSRAYTDAILVAEDGHSERVHRLVISAASSYLDEILKETRGGSLEGGCTTLILPVDGKTLRKLVNFMYNGEIEVREGDVESFLETGRWLGVKGLAGHDNGGPGKQPLLSNSNTDPSPAGAAAEESQAPPPRRERESPLSTTSSLDSIPAAFNIERIQTLASLLAAGAANAPPESATERLAKLRAANTDHDFKIEREQQQLNANASSGVTSPEDVVRDFNQRLRATDPRPCPKCGKVYRSAHTLRTHLEDKHTVCPGYRCVLCGTIAKSRNSLHSHMSRQHRGISTKDLPLVEVARGGGPGYESLGAPGGGAGGGGERGQGGSRKERKTEGPPSFGEPSHPGGTGVMKPTTTGSAILDTYLHFIAENSLAAAAAYGGAGGGPGGGGGSMSNNTTTGIQRTKTGSGIESRDNNYRI